MIPEELRKIPQWVCTYKDSKIPMQAGINRAASSTDPQTWSDFETAITSVEQGMYNNVGFVFADNGLVGIDIDQGFDGRVLNELSVDVMNHCRSYTEKSRSGRGIHVLVKGTLPFQGRNNRQGVEIYQSSRYFIMTGKTLVFTEIEENQGAIDYLIEKYFSDTDNVADKQSPPLINKPKIYKPIYHKPEGKRIPLLPDYPEVLPGSRHISMVSLAGALYNTGMEKAELYKEILKANSTACKPPLSNREVMNIVNSMFKYER